MFSVLGFGGAILDVSRELVLLVMINMIVIRAIQLLVLVLILRPINLIGNGRVGTSRRILRNRH